eukprot:2017779-Pyramimonas_sp.AAC.1
MGGRGRMSDITRTHLACPPPPPLPPLPPPPPPPPPPPFLLSLLRSSSFELRRRCPQVCRRETMCWVEETRANTATGALGGAPDGATKRCA